MGGGVGAACDGDDGVVLDHEDATQLGYGGFACVKDLLVVVLLEGVGLFVAQMLQRDVGEGEHDGL